MDKLKVNKKNEAQVFCDRRFQAFEYKVYQEAGSKLKFQVKAQFKTIKCNNLLWQSRLLLEVKS